jgi:hypothetical protein
MTWKYRVVRSLIEVAHPHDEMFPSTEDKYAYTIRDVFHDEQGNPLHITEETIPYGETRMQLQENLLKMIVALTWPVVDDDKEYE